MTLEITYNSSEYDVDFDVIPGQPQTLEQEGIPLSVELTSITFHHRGDQLLEIVSDEFIDGIKEQTLATLIDQAF